MKQMDTVSDLAASQCNLIFTNWKSMICSRAADHLCYSDGPKKTRRRLDRVR